MSPYVRPLRGEDLADLVWADLPARARALGEAQMLVGAVDELDCWAACHHDRVLGIAALGCRTPFGGASLAALAVDPEPPDTVGDPTHALLGSLERRASERTCTSVDIRVDVADPSTLAVVENRGYALIGATTTAFPVAQAVIDRHVDSWLLRKELTA